MASSEFVVQEHQRGAQHYPKVIELPAPNRENAEEKVREASDAIARLDGSFPASWNSEEGGMPALFVLDLLPQVRDP